VTRLGSYAVQKSSDIRQVDSSSTSLAAYQTIAASALDSGSSTLVIGETW
jgi:hypothetical protein